MEFLSPHHYLSAVAAAILIILGFGANADVITQVNNRSEALGGKSCDFFKGTWVYDKSYPLYNPLKCPFVEREFSCRKNGRRDAMYLKYRWKPTSCDLARFDGLDFLRRFQGKTIMFVGDSLSLNQWLSLTCLLYSSVPTANYTMKRGNPISTFTIPDYGISVKLVHNLYLVDVVSEKIGRVLKLNSIQSANEWIGVDTLIFNTWHWWNRRGNSQPFDYIQEGNRIYKDMNRVVAFGKALTTWGKWVDANIDPTKTKIFFQGISPSHYNGSEWNEPTAKSCLGQVQPLLGFVYPGGPPLALSVLKNILRMISKPVYLLDITGLSQLRKDGHPSVYGLNRQTIDCSHWCLAGVPDIWNQILYNTILN